ncbi:MAG: SPW repeat protein [bacterium]
MWQAWVSGVIGLWLILSAFLGFSNDFMVWNLVITGILVAVFGFWTAGSK